MKMLHTKTARRAVLALAVWLAPAIFAAAQQPPPGPITPPPDRTVRRVPAAPRVEAPPMPLEEMVRRISETEEQMQQAFLGYSFRGSVRIQEWDVDGSPVGELQLQMEVSPGEDGRLRERQTAAPRSTLKILELEREDVRELARQPLFILTPPDLPFYQITYLGRQPVDELETFAFRVTPRQLERTRRYFDGVVWVDQQDFVIVKTYGRMVAEAEITGEELPFGLVEIFREHVDRRFWFPSFIRSDDTRRLDAGEARLRLTIRYTDFQAAPQP
jgi:hypothetical protein